MKQRNTERKYCYTLDIYYLYSDKSWTLQNLHIFAFLAVNNIDLKRINPRNFEIRQWNTGTWHKMFLHKVRVRKQLTTAQF